MEQNRLEHKIRTRLQERELQPSPEAWKKLEAKLGGSKKRKHTYWYAVAAVFIGFLVVAALVYNEEKQVSTEIVEQPVEVKNIEDPSEEVIPQPETQTAVQISEDANPETQIQKGIVSEKIIKKPEIEEKAIPREEIAKVEVKGETIQKSLPEIITTNEDFFNNKVKEVVAEAKTLKEKNSEVTAEEIDQLLEKAQRELSTQRILINPQKVDATALLEDVEMEMERSFRDKVFDALGESFEKIRSAVAERKN